MRLNQAQIEAYSDIGWIMLPELLAPDEIAVLEDAALEVVRRPGPEVSREADGSPHVCWGMHLFDRRLQALARHPRLVVAAEQLLGNKIFVHQSRINVKQTGGSIVEWHQDFGTYHRVDGIPEPRGIMIAVFLDDITACNAPLLAVPRSQHGGLVSEARVDPTVPDHESTSKYRYDITPETMRRLVDAHGLEAITGRAGSVVFMNMAVVHGSSVNITPLRRIILYLNVSAVDNRGESFERPEYYAARDFSPIQALDEDCLLAFRDGPAA